jgi:hypothetical protein
MWPSNHPPSASRTSSEAGRFAGIVLKQRFKISNVSCKAVHLQEQSGYLLKGYRFVRIYLESRSIWWNWSEVPDVLIKTYHCDVTRKVLYSLYPSITTHLLRSILLTYTTLFRTGLQAGRVQIRFPMGSLEYFIGCRTMALEVDSASNIN